MDLKNSLCQVDPNDRSLLHGCLLRCGWSCNITQPGTLRCRREGASTPSKPEVRENSTLARPLAALEKTGCDRVLSLVYQVEQLRASEAAADANALMTKFNESELLDILDLLVHHYRNGKPNKPETKQMLDAKERAIRNSIESFPVWSDQRISRAVSAFLFDPK
jgi:hypothetical protein